MNWNEYTELAQRTARKEMELEKRLAVAGLGIAGEAGEVAEVLKKHIGHGHELSVDDICRELGDVLWYVQEIAWIVRLPLEYIAEKNIEKLKARYPQGFSEHASIHREE